VGGARRSGDGVEHLLGEHGFDGHVHRGHVDPRPRGTKDDASGLGVKPEVEFVSRARGELRIIGLRVQAAFHEGDAFRQLGDARLD
jgi:hypothetical protein